MSSLKNNAYSNKNTSNKMLPLFLMLIIISPLFLTLKKEAGFFFVLHKKALYWHIELEVKLFEVQNKHYLLEIQVILVSP